MLLDQFAKSSFFKRGPKVAPKDSKSKGPSLDLSKAISNAELGVPKKDLNVRQSLKTTLRSSKANSPAK